MAHRGAAPKTIKHGRTPTADWTDVPDTPFIGPSPDLPKLSGRRKWNELVAQWWEQVRAMPHCALWRATDWTFGIETALMKHDFYADPETRTTSAATEIRRREAQLGTTAEARRQLRIRYVPVDEAGDELDNYDTPVEVTEQDAAATGGATVTPLADRRARLTRPA